MRGVEVEESKEAEEEDHAFSLDYAALGPKTSKKPIYHYYVFPHELGEFLYSNRSLVLMCVLLHFQNP